METVKVDIQKLQMLNDRINQTIDALSQLRKSVHAYQSTAGLQHSEQSFQPQQQVGFGYNMAPQYPQQMGLQHTPFMVPQQQQPAVGYNVQNWPYAQTGWGGPVGGLSHTGIGAVDPSVIRLTQTFPYALSPIPFA